MTEPLSPGLAPARTLTRRGIGISLVALTGFAAVCVLAIGFTPVEARQGLAQKIFYLHVPAASSELHPGRGRISSFLCERRVSEMSLVFRPRRPAK